MCALAAVLALQAGWFALTTSGTPDETTYLRAGLAIYQHGDFSALAEDGIAPLPVLLSFAAPALAGGGYAHAIRLARLSAIVLIGIPLVVLAYVTLLRTSGRAVAATGAALLAFSPNMIAHSALAATDICFVAASLAALLALARFVEARTGGRLLTLHLALAVALAAKYSAATLFPAAFIVLAVTDSERVGLARTGHALAQVVGMVATSLLVVWALHGFALAPARLAVLGSTRVPAVVAGLVSQAQHQRGGHPAFLLGRTSNVGWWYYMPVALALKSTTAELVAIAFGLAALATGWQRRSVDTLIWSVTAAVFATFTLVNRLGLGVRYGLLLVPLLLFLALERWGRDAAGRVLLGGCIALVGLQAASAFAIGPHYLSYFNRWSGGPSVGYRYLADSNIDWGQDLPAMRDAIARLGGGRVLISYFGNAPFDEYGVSASVWDSNVQRDFDRWDWAAISVTHLDGLFVPSDVFEPFRSVSPSARAGHSILIYSTKRDDVRAAMGEVARRWRAIVR